MINFGNLCDVLEDARHVKELGCYDFTNNGVCSKCGSCCSTFLPLQKSEIIRLKKLIKRKHLKPHTLPVVVTAIDLTCPFLTDECECSIYDDRPYICRTFKCDKKPSVEEFINIKEPFIPCDMRDLFKE